MSVVSREEIDKIVDEDYRSPRMLAHRVAALVEQRNESEIARLRAELEAAREAIRYMVVEVGLSSDGLPKYEITGDPDRLQLTDVQPAVRAACEGKR